MEENMTEDRVVKAESVQTKLVKSMDDMFYLEYKEESDAEMDVESYRKTVICDKNGEKQDLHWRLIPKESFWKKQFKKNKLGCFVMTMITNDEDTNDNNDNVTSTDNGASAKKKKKKAKRTPLLALTIGVCKEIYPAMDPSEENDEIPLITMAVGQTPLIDYFNSIELPLALLLTEECLEKHSESTLQHFLQFILSQESFEEAPLNEWEKHECITTLLNYADRVRPRDSTPLDAEYYAVAKKCCYTPIEDIEYSTVSESNLDADEFIQKHTDSLFTVSK